MKSDIFHQHKKFRNNIVEKCRRFVERRKEIFGNILFAVLEGNLNLLLCIDLTQ